MDQRRKDPATHNRIKVNQCPSIDRRLKVPPKLEYYSQPQLFHSRIANDQVLLRTSSCQTVTKSIHPMAETPFLDLQSR